MLQTALTALCATTINLRVHDSIAATVSPLFIGSTIDVGIAYGGGGPSYDLTQPALLTLARGLAPGILRVGGSTQDKLVYEPPSGGGCPAYVPPKYPCPQEGGTACLSLKRWRELNAFAAATGLRLVFGLNACHGRTAIDQPMDLTPTIQLLNETATANLQVYAFELGNELDGSYHGSDGVAPAALAADLQRLSDALQHFWPRASTRPKLFAPDVVVYTGNTGSASAGLDLSTSGLPF